MRRLIVIGFLLICSALGAFFFFYQSEEQDEVGYRYIRKVFDSRQFVKAESENFRLFGPMETEPASDLLRDMEIFRKVLFRYFEIEETAPYPKFDILLVRDPTLFEALIGMEWGGAYYTRNGAGNTTVVGPYSLTLASDEFLEVMFHEYVHHFNAFHMNYAVPAWLNEGLAEYFSTMRWTSGDDFEVGHVIERRLKNLKMSKKGWLEKERVIGSIEDYPFARTGGSDGARVKGHRFYNQSWLLSHWLVNTTEGRKVFQQIGPTMNAGRSLIDIFPEDLEKRVKSYVKSDQFKPATVKLKVGQDDTEVVVDTVIREVYYQRALLELAYAAPSLLRVEKEKIYFRYLERGPIGRQYISLYNAIKYCDDGTRYTRHPVTKMLKSGDIDYQMRRAAIYNMARCITHDPFESIILGYLEDAVEIHDQDLDLFLFYITRRERFGLTPLEREMFQSIMDGKHYESRPRQALNLASFFVASENPDEARAILGRIHLWDKDEQLTDKVLDFQKDIEAYESLYGSD